MNPILNLICKLAKAGIPFQTEQTVINNTECYRLFYPCKKFVMCGIDYSEPFDYFDEGLLCLWGSLVSTSFEDTEPMTEDTAYKRIFEHYNKEE